MKNKFLIYGAALTEYRKQAGLTQEELASGLNINRVTLTGWESKTTVEIDRNQAEKLQTLLGIDINVLTNVPHGTNKETLDLYRSLATERMERITELKEKVEILKKELEQYRGGKAPGKKK